MALLLILDNIKASQKADLTLPKFQTLVKFDSKFINTILLVTVLTGGIGAIYNMKYIWPKTLTPKARIVDEFKRLGHIGIISDYWNLYVTSCPNPDLIIATPNEQAFVRNNKMAEDVFKQPNIYIIKDMWLQTFPDSMSQFHRLLVKDGNEFE